MKIIFSTTNKVLSRVIRWFSNSKTSHIVFELDLYGVPVILQASIGGVQILTKDAWFKEGNIVVSEYEFCVDMTQELPDAIKHLGDRYDYVGLFGFIPIMIWRWFGKKIKNPLASPKAVICTELLFLLNRDGKLKEFVGLDPTATTPEDLLEICNKSQDFILCRS